jgi:hypothetical protein
MFLAIFLCGSAPGADPPKETLAVADFTVKGRMTVPNAGQAVSDLLLSAFEGRFETVTRDQLELILGQRTLNIFDLMAADDPVAYTRGIRLHYLVMGELKTDGDFSITARIVNPGVWIKPKTPLQISAPTFEELQKKIPDLAARLHETTVAAKLNMVCDQELIFKNSCMVDQDNDKIGEYGLLGEMVGEIALRTDPARFVSPLINQDFRTGGAAGGGFATVSGYNYGSSD